MFEVSYFILIPNFFALFALMFMLTITLRPNKSLLDDSDSDSDEEPPVKEKKPPVRYEDKYKEQLNKLVKNNIEKGTENQEPKKEYQGKTMVIESTPLGNVMMTWNKDRESFIYYADSTIPYRFLETVARKYVIMCDCPELYIDMDAEIEACKKEQEDKRKLEEEEKEKKELFTINECDGEQTVNNDKSSEPRKRDVFAKFKTYNNESIKSKAVNISNKKAPPVPRNTNVNTNEKKDVILKTKANRYSCEGKLINFPFVSILKRTDHTPPVATSFAEFKRMHMLKK
jgi:hypothetical protein